VKKGVSRYDRAPQDALAALYELRKLAGR
jgi:hypothetical protein